MDNEWGFFYKALKKIKSMREDFRCQNIIFTVYVRREGVKVCVSGVEVTYCGINRYYVIQNIGEIV